MGLSHHGRYKTRKAFESTTQNVTFQNYNNSLVARTLKKSVHLVSTSTDQTIAVMSC